MCDISDGLSCSAFLLFNFFFCVGFLPHLFLTTFHTVDVREKSNVANCMDSKL